MSPPFSSTRSLSDKGCVVVIEDVRRSFHLVETEVKEYMRMYEVRRVSRLAN